MVCTVMEGSVREYAIACSHETSNPLMLGMRTLTRETGHRLLRGLFYICEAVFVASFTGMLSESAHAPGPNASMAFVIAFWLALLALLVVCFVLRRTARQLAVIGWTTAFILVLLGLMIPTL